MSHTYNGELLKEVKKGEYGRGLLIERDGHIYAESDTINQIREDIDTNKQFVIPDKFIVHGVFQRYDALNHNGRIYPKNVLVPKVEKYINESVANRSAFGALDHPECFLEDVNVLTPQGWRKIGDIKVGDEVFTMNEDRRVVVEKVIHTIKSEYSGHMVRMSGDGIDVTVTPNHKFPIYGRKGCEYIGHYKAEDIKARSIENMDGCVIPVVAEFEDVASLDLFDIFAGETHKEEEGDAPLTVSTEVFLKFLAAVYAYNADVDTDKGMVQFVLDDDEQIDNVHTIAEAMDQYVPYDSVDVISKDMTFVTFYDYRLADIIQECKYLIPKRIKRLAKNQIAVFLQYLEEYNIGLPVEKDVAMGVCEMYAKIGQSAALVKKEKGYFVDNGHIGDISLASDDIDFDIVDYSGFVYCITVPNHTFYAMDENGHCFWSGNSDGLSGHDVSHIVTELHWEGPTLVGEMELNLTEGFRRYGVATTSGDHVANFLINKYLIGVSSRAVGSVVQKFGRAYVDDSLQIIAFDVVLQPSTNCAYISPDREDVQTFINMDRQSPLSEAISRAEKLLL